MNYSKLKPGSKMEQVYKRLLYGGPATSAQIQDECQVVAPATWISALRHNGIPVTCTYKGRTESGAKVYEYSL